MKVCFWGRRGPSARDVVWIWAVLASLVQEICGQTVLSIECPPAFPNMERFFQRTLSFEEKRERFSLFKMEAATPVNCTYSPKIMKNIDHFNYDRCSGNKTLVMVCPIPTTTTTTTTTTTFTTTTTTRRTRPPVTSRTTSHSTTRVPSTRTTHSGVLSTAVPSPHPPTVPSLPSETQTSSSLTPDFTVTSVEPPLTVVQREEQMYIVAISIGAGVLAVIVIAVALLICRRHLHASSGAVELSNKHEKAQRQRSDCQPISSISQNDMSDGHSKDGSPSSSRYNRGYVTNGRKWRPEHDGQSEDDCSEKSGHSGKYILLREDSSTSATSFSTHYNTLRTIDHPHALILGGFGESSTDMTLPRRFREQLRRSQELQFLEGSATAGGVAETKFINDPADKNANNPQAEDAYDPMRSLADFDTLVPVQKRNGSVPVGNGDVQREKEADRHSLDTLDAADAVLDQEGGKGNAGYQPDEDPDEAAIKDWKTWVIDELATHNHSSDSLVDPRNEHLFAYENKGLQASIPSVKEEVLEPPPEFRDTSNCVEPTVAVVQPSVQKSNSPKKSFLHGQQGAGVGNARQKQGVARGSTNTPVVGKTAPFSYTPSPNGYSSLHRGNSQLPQSSEITSSNGAIVTNGKLVMGNGSLPHKGRHGSGKKTFLHDQSWIKSENEKPAAQVPPIVKELH